jgi:eukaryotic-like serine/threonine-protein kinase
MATTDQLNTALDGRYAIDRLIGEGGMATVYLARDVRHKRRVALKVLKPDLGAVVGVERFLSEIQVTANLQHPNLLPLFDSGAADHLLFYVMPYIEGESLRARLEREKQLPVDEAVRIAVAVASALDYAHRHGVIHRDLKPENILLHEGQPLVADFGIALAVSNAGGNRITQTGLSLGTPQYMSPEQATSDRAIDGRTDIYSLGAVTYEMLSGEAPHTGATSQAIIARLLTERPRSLRSSRPSVPEQVEAAVERALEKLPADRWDTAKEFSEALTGARLVTRSTSATPVLTTGMIGTASRPLPRELAAWAVAAMGIVATTLLVMRQDEEPTPGVPAEFEVQVPDDIDVAQAGAGGANTIAISQDGSTLVFAASQGGERRLFVRRLDDRDAVPIRGSDSAGVPSLSPDGEHVLFPARGQGAGGRGAGGLGGGFPVKRLAVRGGTARTVVDSGIGNGQVSWGDAGKLVVTFRNGLWTVPAEGGQRTLLASPDSARRHFRYGFPHVLPGGKAALITIWHGAGDIDSTVLGVVTIPGGEVTDLGIRGTNPQYSGTGHILFATDASLFALPFSSRSLRATGVPFPVVEGVSMGRGGAAAFAVARNGTLVYRTGALPGGDGTASLVAVTRTGDERPLGSTRGRYSGPRISPDGRQIAMTIPAIGGRAGGDFPDIWRFDTASKVFTRVTADSSSVYASWSSDGERLAFTRRERDSVVMWQPLYQTGRPAPLVTTGADVRAFALPRAGAYAALRVGAASNFDIWLVRMDSLSSPRPFLTEPYMETSPELSPDGRLIAYWTNRTGQPEVYIRRVPSGADEVRVSVNGGTEPVWAPNGRELFFRGPRHMMTARVTEGARLAVSTPDTLFLDPYGKNPNRAAYDIFPDGREFVFVRPGGPSQTAERSRLIVMMNWHLRSRIRDESGER